ncbi:MAG: hypothetical protein KGZ42_07270 [Melioribacter sp.]|nr:hypothetical protein [Melioribacter sp.]
MPSIYFQKNSPHYWIFYYDRFNPNPAKRKQRFNSKIEITSADKKKIELWLKTGADPSKKPKINGNEKTKQIINALIQGRLEKEIAIKTGIKIKSPVKLSEGCEEYIANKIKIGDRKSIKSKTQEMYRYSVKHFIEATGRDDVIHKYYPGDYAKLMALFEEKDYAEATRETFSNHLHILWNYFVKQNYCLNNIITVYQPATIQKPQDIPLNEFKIILRFYSKQPEKYEWVYYLLLTMARPSTALVQKRSKIDFTRKYIEMLNVKGTRKRSPYFIYPLFRELEELIKRIMERPVVDNSDRLFSHFKIGNNNYTDSFWWWYADQKKLKMVGLISDTYEMKQIRKTFPSYAINELGFSKEEIKFLLDHTDESVAENYYLNLRYDTIRDKFEKKRIIEDYPNIYSLDPPIKFDPDEKEIQRKIDLLVKKHRNKLNINKDELAEMLKKNIPITHIARKYGVSDVAIHKKIKLYKLKKK